MVIKNICAIVVIIFLSPSCTNHNTQKINKTILNKDWKKIPNTWITKAKRFKYKKVDTILLNQFSAHINPDTIWHPKGAHVDPNYGLLFNCLFTDLDSDGSNELLCLQGWDVYRPYLCVFKEVDHQWYLIYKEEVSTFYGSPTLYVAGNYSPNKTFYLRTVNNHGSGIYLDGYTFYKLENNKVYKCLHIVNNAHIYGWGLLLNQIASSKFEFIGDSDDALQVDYTYNFFPGSICPTDNAFEGHEETPLIHGEDNVTYQYDKNSHTYKLDIPRYKKAATDLTHDKITCFDNFGNDSLFVKAYETQIDTMLKIGSPSKKKVLYRYLKLVQNNKRAKEKSLH